ncbi:hypothetical protein G7A72_03325 [Flavobacterium sp. Sr18]|nr:hypothetical protein [Flavobacterium sp. Sr18]QIH37889.1 hypothetical protein G7A72_03325 [Flavobacterium sp. Sr18]
MKKNEICPLVEAACCISANGKGYNIDKDFNGWLKIYINDKINKENKKQQ